MSLHVATTLRPRKLKFLAQIQRHRLDHEVQLARGGFYITRFNRLSNNNFPILHIFVGQAVPDIRLLPIAAEDITLCIRDAYAFIEAFPTFLGAFAMQCLRYVRLVALLVVSSAMWVAAARAQEAAPNPATTPAPRADDWWQKRHEGMN